MTFPLDFLRRFRLVLLMNALSWIFLGAAGLWLGMANPLCTFPLAAFAYPVALFMLGTAATSKKQAFRWGFTTGLIGASACLYWLSIPVHDFGGLPWVLAVPCAFFLGAYIGLYGGFFAVLVYEVRPLSAWRSTLVLGLGWYVLECFRGWFFTGFPWLSLATAFAPYPALVQSASLIGAYGLGGLFAGLACLGARTLLPQGGAGRWLSLATAVLGLALLGGWGHFVLSTERSTPSVPIALVQGNLDQNVKWEPSMQRLTVQRYVALSAQALAGETVPSLIVWPETAMPFNYQMHVELSPVLRHFARERATALLFGAPGFRRTPGGMVDTFNRAYLVSAEGADVAWYDKEHLVPFGEYLPPFLDFPFLYQLLQGVGEFTPGEKTAPLVVPALSASSHASATAVDTLKEPPLVLGVLICYESIFPELARKQVAEGATVLINISNDAWFGRSSAPEQHLALGLLRAVEQRRWLARATNTGISAFVSPYGEVVARSGLFTAETLTHAVAPSTETTLFFRLQPYLPWLGLLAFALLVFPLWRRGQRP